MPQCWEWQYYVPRLGAGLIEISKSINTKRDKSHVRSLLRIKFDLERLPSGTIVFPYYSMGGALLRERARDEGLPTDDRLEVKNGATKMSGLRS